MARIQGLRILLLGSHWGTKPATSDEPNEALSALNRTLQHGVVQSTGTL